MSRLINARWEAFAQALAKGMATLEAARAAGYPCKQFGDHVGFYVYFLVDPRDGAVFYVGKGKGKRHAVHDYFCRKASDRNVRKMERISAIWAAGHRVDEVCVQDGLEERSAFAIERALIRLLRHTGLCNRHRGQGPDYDALVARSLRLKRHILSVPFERWLRQKPRADLEIKMRLMLPQMIDEDNEMARHIQAGKPWGGTCQAW